MELYENSQMYRCYVNEITLTRNTTDIVITGAHLQNKTDLDVQVVDMHSLPSIVNDFFTTFPNLRILVVSDISVIQQGAFENAHNLVRLTIQNSPLPVLPAYAFDGAPNISTLYILACDTTVIDENALSGLTQLQTVTIIAKLQILPENVFSSLVNLERAFLAQNNIGTIHPALFDNNLKLITAYFDGNRINAVAKSLVDTLYARNINQFTFEGNNCGNSTYHISYIDRVHAQLDQCYRNYEELVSLS
ncbi:hypothetical protein HA402_001540 [Bradysia odoriphaga]|nr:hypothetical protein HA402_001540 [Bradysia odoriphaga]